MTDSDSPRLATFDDDGWSLQDAEERLARGDDLYWLPDRWTREHLEEHMAQAGFVKLIFAIPDPSNPRVPAIERMWVRLTGRHGEFYHGHLANAPYTEGRVEEGMPVWFRAEHVIDFAGPNGEDQASESPEALRCQNHGPSYQCYVCKHLKFEGDARGFHTADPEALRPDAWCDECHAEYVRFGSWEAPGVREPEIMVVCGGCYDALKRRHTRPSPA